MTKGLLLGTLSTSIIIQASKAVRRRPPLLVSLFTHAFAFRNPGELLFGASLLYFYRIFERQWGSAKYGSFVATTCCVAYALEAAASSGLGWRSASGPFPLVFANLLSNFVLLVPPMHQFTVFGIKMTDKVRRIRSEWELATDSCADCALRLLVDAPSHPHLHSHAAPWPCMHALCRCSRSSTWHPSSCCSAQHPGRWWRAAQACWPASCTASTSWACSACACRLR